MSSAHPGAWDRGAFLLAALVAFVGTWGGCRGTMTVQQPPTMGAGQVRSLAELKAGLLANDAAFRSLSAEVDAVLRSPILKRPPQLEMHGKLYLEKPRKIYLRLGGPGKTYMTLVGDGEHYVVEMPIFGNVQYEGSYGEPIAHVPDRIHLMPDDLADALDLVSLVAGKALVLRAYPYRWEFVVAGRQQDVMRPVWCIDAILADERREPKVAVLSSLLVDRSTEELVRLDKFHWDGTLRVRVWYQSRRVLRGADGNPVRVPSELILWYPPPLEGTIVRLRLRNIKINRPVPADAFRLGRGQPATR